MAVASVCVKFACLQGVTWKGFNARLRSCDADSGYRKWSCCSYRLDDNPMLADCLAKCMRLRPRPRPWRAAIAPRSTVIRVRASRSASCATPPALRRAAVSRTDTHTRTTGFFGEIRNGVVPC